MKTVAKVLVLDKAGDVLALRRSGSHPHFAHHWDFPGGEVEPGEDPAAAVAREIAEETGLVVNSARLEMAFDQMISDALRHMLFTVRIDNVKPDVVTSWEHEGYAWRNARTMLQEPTPQNADAYYIDVIDWLNRELTSLPR